MKTGRNDPCGSGKKYKKCCLGKAGQAASAVNLPVDQPGTAEPEETELSVRQLIDQGCLALQRKDNVKACRLWWLAWPRLKPLIGENRITAVDELDGLLPGEKSIFQWCRDMERETDKVMEKAWVFAFRRISYTGEFLQLLPDSDVAILEDMRRAVAGSRDFLAGKSREEGYPREISQTGTGDQPVRERLNRPGKKQRGRPKPATKESPPLTGAQAWYATYEKASPREQYDLFMSMARQPLPAEFADSLDPGDLAVGLLDSLKTNNLQEQAVELIESLQTNWSEYYAGEFFYFDSFLVSRFLYLGETGALPGVLGRFTDHPEDGIDYLVPVFSSLVAYQYRDLAVEMAAKLFPVLRSSDKLIRGPEGEFGMAFFADRLERAYAERHEGIDWPALNEAVAPVDYEIRPQLAQEIDTLWSGGFTAHYLRAKLAEDFAGALLILRFGFCRHMREQKSMDFPCSMLMWALFEGLMHENGEQNETSLDFTYAVLEDTVYHQLGLGFLGLSSKKADAAILVWALPYIYDYLHSQLLIDDGLHRRVLAKVIRVKEWLFQVIGDDLWQYAFGQRWEPADSVDEDFRRYEAEVFAYSFSRRVPLREK